MSPSQTPPLPANDGQQTAADVHISASGAQRQAAPSLQSVQSYASARDRAKSAKELHSAHFNSYLGHIRDIRVAAQDLRKSLQNITRQVREGQWQLPQVKEALEQETQIKVARHTEVQAHFQCIRDILNEDAELYDGGGDEVTRMQLAWDKAIRDWPKPPENAWKLPDDTSKLFERIQRPIESLHELINSAAYLSIPHRLNHHLEGLRTGQALDFYDTFSDELDPEDAKALLKRLALYRGTFDGLLDPTTGNVYRASSKVWRWAVSVGVEMLLLFAPMLVAFFLSRTTGPFQGIADKVLSTYFFAMAGGAIHLLISVIKRTRDNNGVAVFAIEDWFMWAHIKETQIIGGILSLWAGVGGLIYYMDSLPKELSDVRLLAFTVGYSVDSLADLFVQRFDTAMSEEIDKLKKALNNDKAQKGAGGTTSSASMSQPGNVRQLSV